MPESDELRYDSEESTPLVSADVRSLPQGELKALASELLSTVDGDGVAIAIVIAANTANMVCTVSCGNMAPPVGALLDVNSGISGQCVREKRMLYSADVTTDSRVDKEVCSRLGIQSVAVSPVLRDSTCIGILEVFSSRAEAFDDAALGRIEEETVRAASLIKLEEPGTGLKLTDPQVRKKWPLFLVDKPGGLSQDEEVAQNTIEENAEATENSLSLPNFLSLSPAQAQPRRWVAFAAAVVASAILGFVLIRYMNSSVSISPKNTSAAGTLANDHSAVRELPTMSSVVSDAAPAIRVLMAKAIAGNSNAQASLAEHYAAGNGVTPDRVKATVWYVLAGAGGDKEAGRSSVHLMQNLQPFEMDQVHFNLGTMFRDGIGTPRNLIVAYSWFSLAQAAGDVRARAALLNLEQVMRPRDVAEGRRRATAWFDSHRSTPISGSPALSSR